MRCLCVYVRTVSAVQGHDWIWVNFMQRWYEFTATGDAAWARIYKNTSMTAKGAESLDKGSWEIVLSAKIANVSIN